MKRKALLFCSVILAPLLIGLFIGSLFPFLDRFTYNNPIIPFFLRVFANFDGVHYLQIAQFGYAPTQYAFFPLYPFLIKIFSGLFFGSYFFSGLFLSLVSYMGALFLLLKYLRGQKENQGTIVWFFALFVLFPTAFFFTSVYTEALFLFLYVGFIYFFWKKNYVAVFLFGLLVGATRFTGFGLILIGFLYLFVNRDKYQKVFPQYFFIASSPLIGLLSYCGYLYIKTGDPLAFFHTLSLFGPQRSSHIVLLPQVLFRYIKILLTAKYDFQYFVASLELVVFLFFLTVTVIGILHTLKKRGWRGDFVFCFFGGFSLLNILIPPLSGSLSSFPRYALMNLFVFYLLAKLPSKPIKIFLLVLFFVLRCVLFAFFTRGYFIS